MNFNKVKIISLSIVLIFLFSGCKESDDTDIYTEPNLIIIDLMSSDSNDVYNIESYGDYSVSELPQTKVCGF